MIKVRVLYNGDGSVSVIYPVPKSRRKDETEKAWLERVFTKANSNNLSYDDVDTEKTPLPDERFRSAWVRGAGGIKIDIVKAKSQVMAELRKVRDGELAKTDGLLMRANEIGSQVDRNKLIQFRQRLRELPQTVGIDAIKTVEELAVTYPDKLSAEECLDLASS